MNDETRFRLKRLEDAVEGLMGVVFEIRSDEFEKWRRMPECLKGQPRSRRMADAVHCLDEVMLSLDKVSWSLLEAAE